MITLVKLLEEQWHRIMKRSTQFILILTLRVTKTGVRLRWQQHRSRAWWWRDKGRKEAEAHTAGAVDGATRSSTHRRGRGHNNPLTLHIPDVNNCPAGGPARFCPLWWLVVFHANKLQTNCLFREYTLFQFEYLTWSFLCWYDFIIKKLNVLTMLLHAKTILSSGGIIILDKTIYEIE